MKVLLFTICLVFICGILYPQGQNAGSVSGSVIDAANSSPLPHAYLFLKKLSGV